eukprot:TRINITY_DN7426_c0_g1_i1.p1 TRINITY_DN7426_c0_g1~~TRINITY_DN7426_c0_g1_i1.p1  ORF type:complete len:551 (-),score=94.82 TRINITY_DN7426_c0_g1_i1:41-1693(-)
MADTAVLSLRGSPLPIRLVHQSSTCYVNKMLELMTSPPAESEYHSSSVILLSERTSSFIYGEEKTSSKKQKRNSENEQEVVETPEVVKIDFSTEMLPVIEVGEEKVEEVSRDPVNDVNENSEEHNSEKEKEEDSGPILQEINEKLETAENPLYRSSRENEPAEIDFDIDTFDPLKETDQIQVHYLIFNFSYWLHSRGDGQTMLTYTEFQKLQRYVTILTEIKNEILECITENIEEPEVIKPLLELNDSVEEILGIYRSKRPESAALNYSAISNYAAQASSRNLLPTASSSNSKNVQVCPICYMDVETSEFIFLHCGHSVCRTCATSYFTLNIEEGKVTKLTCPGGADCEELANEHDVMKVVPHLLEKYRLFSHYNKVRADPNARWCPKPGCGGFAYGSAESPKLECDKCNNHFCFNCNYDWHEGVTCKKNEKLLVKKGVIDKKSENWKKKHRTKPCPSCGASIKKNHGCNHMTCSACGHEFCWVCMANFTWDHFSNGKCNMFSLRHRITNGATTIGAISFWGLLYGVAVPIVIAGAPVYGIYWLGKKAVS